MAEARQVTATQDRRFQTYQLDDAYDEMFAPDGRPRPQYLTLFNRLLELSPSELEARQQSADLSFLHQGVTFTVYSDARGTERIFPYDLLPRIMSTVPLPAVVFVTAFDRYALRAFEVHALDFLTKPVHPERLAQTVGRLKWALSMPNPGLAPPPATVPHPVPATPLEAADLVPLQDDACMRFVKAGSIAAAQSQGDYTRIIAADGKPALIKSTLSHWEARLPAGLFCRISRSLLVNCGQIQQVSRIDREKTKVFFHDIKEPLTLSRLEFRRLRRFL